MFLTQIMKDAIELQAAMIDASIMCALDKCEKYAVVFLDNEMYDENFDRLAKSGLYSDIIYSGNRDIYVDSNRSGGLRQHEVHIYLFKIK